MGALRAAKLQLRGQPFQPDGVDLPVHLGDECASALGVAAAAAMSDLDLLSEEADDLVVIGVVQVNHRDIFHVFSLCSLLIPGAICAPV